MFFLTVFFFFLALGKPLPVSRTKKQNRKVQQKKLETRIFPRSIRAKQIFLHFEAPSTKFAKSCHNFVIGGRNINN